MLDRLKTAYESTVLDHPRIILALLLLLAGLAAWYSDDFELDASADSLTLEQDQDLEYFRQIVINMSDRTDTPPKRPKEGAED